jgi:hypothetical protein
LFAGIVALVGTLARSPLIPLVLIVYLIIFVLLGPGSLTFEPLSKQFLWIVVAGLALTIFLRAWRWRW